MSLGNLLHICRPGTIVLAIVLFLSSLTMAGARVPAGQDECCEIAEASDCGSECTADASGDLHTESPDEGAGHSDCDDESSDCRGTCHCCAVIGFATQAPLIPVPSFDQRDLFPAARSATPATRSLPVDHPPC